MNKLCQLCCRECKQGENAKIVECKRYYPAPVQMELSFKKLKAGSKTAVKNK